MEFTYHNTEDRARIRHEAEALYEKEHPAPMKPTLDEPLEMKLEEPEEGATLEDLWMQSLATELRKSIVEDTVLYMEKPDEMKAYDKAMKTWRKSRDKVLDKYIARVCERDNVTY